MKGKKIALLLQSFEKKDVKNFESFLKSPFHNQNESLVLLFEKLAKNNFETAYFNFKNTNLLLNSTYSKEKINLLFFELSKLIEDYLFIIHNNKKKIIKTIFLAEYCHENDLSKLFSTYLKKGEELQLKEKNKFQDYFLNQFFIERLKIEDLNQNKRAGDINIQKASDTLDIYFILNKLSFLIASKTRLESANIEYQIQFEDEILIKSSEYLPFNENLSIQFYLEQLNLIRKDEKLKHYEYLKKYLVMNSNNLDKKQKVDLGIVLLNSVSKIYQEEKYYRELFELHQYQIENDILRNEKGELLPSVFKNIITVALNINEIDWAEIFLNKYSQYLSKENKKDWYHYCKASIDFEKKEYTKALENLNKSFPKDFFLILSLKRLYLKLFYEINDYTSFTSYHHSLDMYLRRSKDISNNFIVWHKLFLDYTNQLFKIRIYPEKDFLKIKDIEKSIIDTNVLPEKKWLLEKTQTFLK